MDKLEIIKRISQIRIEAHLSARALSQKIGMNDGYINRLESKKDFLPRLETLLDILEVCGVSIEHFFYYDYFEYDKDKQILDNLKKIDSEKKLLLLELMKKL